MRHAGSSFGVLNLDGVFAPTALAHRGATFAWASPAELAQSSRVPFTRPTGGATSRGFVGRIGGGYLASVSDALVVNGSDGQRETWSDDRGEVSFRTIFGADQITSEFTAGVADLGPGGWLGHHRHEPSEVYYVLSGAGIVVVDGEEYLVSAGKAVYIPSNSEHGIRNSGDDPLRFFYVFAVGGSFDQIEYRFTLEQ